MHDHAEIQQLAAAEIDFELDPAERAKLHEALETCSLCRRQASAIRATATVLRRPLDIGTPERVRAVVVGAALQRGRRTVAIRSMLAAALSILVVVGGAVFVGGRGLGVLPVASPVASAPTETAAAPASVAPTQTSIPSTPAPSPTPVATPAPDPGAPLQVGDVVAMVTDGRLVIRTLPETGPNSALFKTRLYAGQRALVLEGPVDADGYPWYRIRVGDIEGWASAGDRDGTPWLSRVQSGLVAFVVDGIDGYSEAIHTIGVDGTPTEAVLFADPAISHYEQLTWSPDGRRLAFVGILADAVDNRSEIFVIDSDGSNLVRLTDDDLYDDGPAWAPDSSRLAFRQAASDPLYAGLLNSEVVVATSDGSAFTVLGPGETPAWSPDSQQIAMTVPAGDAPGVWIQDASGDHRRQVVEAVAPSTTVAWSPDALHLAYTSDTLAVVELETGTITPLAGDAGRWPAWSVRGRIAFASPSDSATPGLFVVDSDGQGLTRMTSDEVGVPEWSPDGRLLLVGAETSGVLAVKDALGGDGKLTTLTVGRSPAWQPRLP
jgi:anti-sigma factor RsiW